MIAPTFEEVVAILVEAQLLGLNTTTPGRIVSYERDLQRCAVEPLIAHGTIVEDGERVPDFMPIINDVPFVFPGSGANGFTWEVMPGDTVLIVFLQRSADRWLGRGGRIDPGDDRHHDHNDAVAIPGLRDFGHPVPPTGVSADAMVLRFAKELRIGKVAPAQLAVDPVVRLSDLAKFVAALGAAIDTLTTATDPSVSALAALAAALLDAGFPSGSSTVKLEPD